MAVQLETGSGEVVTIDETKMLGKRGGEGAVFEIILPSKYSHCCVKEYSPHILNNLTALAERKAKIEYMVKNPVTSQNPSIIICWPIEALYRNGLFVGFMMLKAFNNSEQLEWFKQYGLAKKLKNTSFQSLDGSQGLSALYNRLVISNNLAYALHLIHRTNRYVLVDTKPQNILITHTGNVSIVDLDSLQIAESGQLKFKAPVWSEHYKPPEGYDGRLQQAGDNIIPTSWDNFSYAVMAYQLIIGSHPYGVGTYKSPYDQGTDVMYKIKTGLFIHGSKSAYLLSPNDASLTAVTARWNALPDQLRQLFMLSFEKGQFKPEKRPAMQQWGQALSTSITALQPQIKKKNNTIIIPVASTPIKQPPIGLPQKSSQKKTKKIVYLAIFFVLFALVLIFIGL